MHMKSIDDLIKAFGGVAEFGRVIGKRMEHVGSMRARRSIPARYWLTLLQSEKGREIGITVETLSRLNFGEPAAADDADGADDAASMEAAQ